MKIHSLNMMALLITSQILVLSKINLFANSHDINQHKKTFIESIIQNPLKTEKSGYPLSRVLFTINASDSDYIPKVPHAGEIFGKGESYLIS